MIATASIAALMGVIACRGAIVRVAPQTDVLFGLAGMPVNLVGLDLGGVSAKTLVDGDRRILLVSGDVYNSTDRARPVPAIKVSIQGAAGETLYAWTTRLPQQKIERGERAAFTARLASPPPDGATIAVEFDRSGQVAPAALPPKAKK